MGWNTARVTLVPPGWEQVVESAPFDRPKGRPPVKISRPKRSSVAVLEPISTNQVSNWLAQVGFREQRAGDSFSSWQLEDVEVFLADEGVFLAEAQVTFTLCSDSPSRWARWLDFVAAMCEKWRLHLYDYGKKTQAPPSALFDLLSQSPSWHDLSAAFRWPSPPVT